MMKRFFCCAIALTTMVSLVSAQEKYTRISPDTPMYYVGEDEGSVANGGTLVYDNSFPQISNLPACGGLSCEACGNFFTTGIWTSGNNRYYSDDIGLGAGPRQLVRYNFIVCGNSGAAGSQPMNVNITSSLWTINLDGLPTSAPGSMIAGTQSITPITVPAAPGACFTIEVKTTPVVLPESLHLVVTSSLQSAASGSPGTGIAVLDPAEYGTNANQHRRSLAGLATQPDPNDNADWAGPAAFSATPTCPSAGAGGCTSGCAPYAAAWGHIYATAGSCGDGVVGAGETCDNSDPCCIACQIATAGTSCRASAGACDPAEACDGTNTACPADLLAGAGTPCRASSGPCDPAESCDGNSATCPPDQTITACVTGDGCCPSGCNHGNDADCPLVVVPTVSEWGLMVLTLIGLAAGAVLFRKRTAANN